MTGLKSTNLASAPRTTLLCLLQIEDNCSGSVTPDVANLFDTTVQLHVNNSRPAPTSASQAISRYRNVTVQCYPAGCALGQAVAEATDLWSRSTLPPHLSYCHQVAAPPAANLLE